MEQDLWGNSVTKQGSFFVYHDESIPNKRWLLIGLLFVPKHRKDNVLKTLEYYRQQENYWGEIHFSALPGSFGGQYGAKARVARHWMRSYQNGLCQDAFFSVLAVDRYSPAFDHHRFSKDFHAYNRFTAMALKAGIVWHLGPYAYEEVELFFVSDAKDRASRPDQDIVDNFEEYIPYRADLDSFLAKLKGKRYPKLEMGPVQLRDSAKDELLQLTDLLLGATQEALVARSTKPTKLELGHMVCAWCRDLQNKPWEQNYKMHRKFSLWAFPDADGRPYNNPSLALTQDIGPPLF